MDKKESIKKNINIIGKVGRITATVLIVLCIIGAVFILGATVISAALPKDSVEISLTGTADVKINSDFINSVKEKFVTVSKEGGTDFGIEVGGANLIIDNTDSDELINQANITETEEGLTISLDNIDYPVHFNRIVYSMAASLIYAICIIITLFTIRALMKALEKCDSPFNEKVINNITVFGYSLIPFCVLKGICESAWTSIFSKQLQFDFSIDLVMVVIVLVVFMLVRIFTYGAELQKESDETL